nr:AMP-binding protein [Streptomyces sp. S1D4-11]
MPVPTAFTAQQAASLLQSADLCLTDAAGEAALARWHTSTPQPVLPDGCPAVALDLPDLTRAPRPAAPPQIPGHDQIVKVIHTSGTTSAPKGVQIRRHGLDELLTSLRARTRPEIFERYLSIVPLSLLIEQVA